MYQTVIRDPGGQGLIRVWSDPGSTEHAVVNGSVLIVPAHTTACAFVNGQASPLYAPGTYELFTGQDPFFVRWRNVMTHGDAAVSVTVFFVSTGVTRNMLLGTGEFAFRENRFGLTLHAAAPLSLDYSIQEPRILLQKLVGGYNTAFGQSDLEPRMQQLLLMPAVEELSHSLQGVEAAQFNNNLSGISRNLLSRLRAPFSALGLGISRLSVNVINVNADDMQKLNKLELQMAEGENRIRIEKKGIDTIYGGDLAARMMGEAVTGIPSRWAPPGETPHPAPPAGGMGGMGSMMGQMMVLGQMMPYFREQMQHITDQADLFGGRRNNAHGETPTENAPPPLPTARAAMPPRTQKCPLCNAVIPKGAARCPVCGNTL